MQNSDASKLYIIQQLYKTLVMILAHNYYNSVPLFQQSVFYLRLLSFLFFILWAL